MEVGASARRNADLPQLLGSTIYEPSRIRRGHGLHPRYPMILHLGELGQTRKPGTTCAETISFEIMTTIEIRSRHGRKGWRNALGKPDQRGAGGALAAGSTLSLLAAPDLAASLDVRLHLHRCLPLAAPGQAAGLDVRLHFHGFVPFGRVPASRSIPGCRRPGRSSSPSWFFSLRSVFGVFGAPGLNAGNRRQSGQLFSPQLRAAAR